MKGENLGVSLVGLKRKTWARHWYQGTDVASRKRKILGTSLVGRGKTWARRCQEEEKHGHIAGRKRENQDKSLATRGKTWAHCW